MKCGICSSKATKSSIISGVYYANICDSCYTARITPNSSGEAAYNRSIDIQDNEADIIQPFDGSGKPSADFIRLYPESAAKTMTQEQIEKAFRV
jgi:hypothetical protein